MQTSLAKFELGPPTMILVFIYLFIFRFMRLLRAPPRLEKSDTLDMYMT